MSTDLDISTLRFDRVCRTLHSDAFLVSDGEEPVGRVDLHYGTSVVHGLVILERDVADEQIQRLIQRLDEDLVWTADQPRDDFVVTVYRGSEVGVYSDPEEEHAHDDEADWGDGRERERER